MHSEKNTNEINFERGRCIPLGELRMIIAACPDEATAIVTIVARYRIPIQDAHALVGSPFWTLFHRDAAS